MPGQRVKLADPLDLIAKKFHPHGLVLALGGVDFDHIPAHPEFSAGKGDVVAFVEHLDQLRQKGLARQALSGPERHEHLEKILRRSQAVNARHAGHDNRIPARQQRAHRRQPQTLDLLVDRRILFDERIRARQVGLGLVVVEIAHKIFHRIAREKLFELAVELGRQGLVVGHDQRRTVQIPDHIRDGERLAGTCHSEQRLVAVASQQRATQCFDRLPLIPARLVARLQLKFHSRPVSPRRLRSATAGIALVGDGEKVEVSCAGLSSVSGSHFLSR